MKCIVIILISFICVFNAKAQTVDDLHNTTEKTLNVALKQSLDSIYINDQKYRSIMEDTAKIYGQNSTQMYHLRILTATNDRINQQKICSILDKYGWLGKDVVGDTGNSALYLVIQHADSTTQIKYLPMMETAVKKGNAKPSNLAYLEDRIAMKRGKKQIYGSQFIYNDKTNHYELWPIEDMPNVNKRRTEVGLGKLEDYVKEFGPGYTLIEYKDH